MSENAASAIAQFFDIAVTAPRILLVDDQVMVREAIAALIDGLGYAVTAVDDPVEALECLRAGERFAAVLSDLIMPGPMNGADLAREVKARYPVLPIIITTGSPWAVSSGELKLPAGIPVLVKPFTRADLANALAHGTRLSRVH